MKTMNLLFAFFISLIVFSACKKEESSDNETNKYGETLTLKVGESDAIESENLIIKFEEIVEDSRCPEDAECFWEGQAVVKFSLNNAQTFELILRDGKEELARDTLDDIIYTLLDVKPFPEVDKIIEPDAYIIDVRADKL